MHIFLMRLLNYVFFLLIILIEIFAQAIIFPKSTTYISGRFVQPEIGFTNTVPNVQTFSNVTNTYERLYLLHSVSQWVI